MIKFLENVTNSGNIRVSWEADTPREWKHTLNCLKLAIPQDGRQFEYTTSTWIIKSKYLAEYNRAKLLAIGEIEGEETELSEQLINDGALIEAVNPRLDLRGSMKDRAAYAIKAVLGMIETDVEFSVSRGVYAAYLPIENIWCYEDGHYSNSSPSQEDSRIIQKAQERFEKAYERLNLVNKELDGQTEAYEKIGLRHSLLSKYNYKCHVCDMRPDSMSKLHMHRVKPGRLGGKYEEENVVIVCWRCHAKVEGMEWGDIENMRRNHE